MTKLRSLLMLFLLTFMLGGTAHADFWEPAGLPGSSSGSGSSVWALLGNVNGTRLFAGTTNGVFYTDNDGATWVPSNLTTKTQALAAIGTNLFAGTYGNGVYLSTDNGVNWTQLPVNTGLTNYDVRALAVSGTNLFAGTYFGGSSVFRSTDNGSTWTQVSNDLPGNCQGVLANKCVMALAVSGANLFAGTSDGVFTSNNNGANWNPVNTGFTPASIGFYNDVRAFAFSGANIVVGASARIYFSANNVNAISWTEVNPSGLNGWVYSFAVRGADLFAGSNGGGVFRSTNDGASWITENTGLTNLGVFSFALSGTHLFTGTNGGGVFRTTQDLIPASPDLSVTKACAVNGTQSVLCTVTVTNNGSAPSVSPITLTDIVTGAPSDATYTGAGGSLPIGCTPGAGPILPIACTANASLQPTESKNAFFSFTLPQGGMFTNCATVVQGNVATPSESDTANNTNICTTITVPPLAPLTATLTIVKDVVPNDAQDFAFYAFGPNSGSINHALPTG